MEDFSFKKVVLIFLIPAVIFLTLSLGYLFYLWSSNDYSRDFMQIDDCLDTQYNCWDYKNHQCRINEPGGPDLCNLPSQ